MDEKISDLLNRFMEQEGKLDKRLLAAATGQAFEYEKWMQLIPSI